MVALDTAGAGAAPNASALTTVITPAGTGAHTIIAAIILAGPIASARTVKAAVGAAPFPADVAAFAAACAGAAACAIIPANTRTRVLAFAGASVLTTGIAI